MIKIVTLLTLLAHFTYAGELKQIQKACDKQVATACYEIAILSKENLKDTVTADKFFTLACEYGYEKACSMLESKDTKVQK